ncbi:MAG TPA: hypothetical protein VFF26_08455 [Gallionella sp.]|nr:hypothetical protein [Gallionella sp.]
MKKAAYRAAFFVAAGNEDQRSANSMIFALKVMKKPKPQARLSVTGAPKALRLFPADQYARYQHHVVKVPQDVPMSQALSAALTLTMCS